LTDIPDDTEPIPVASRLGLVAGALLLTGLIVLVAHLDEERRLLENLRRAQPLWLLAGAALQVATYLCAAGVWRCALPGGRVRMRSLVPLGVIKLFTDQAIPSAGLSGTLVVVRALVHRGLTRGEAAAAMLVGLVSFYAAYAVAVGAALVALAALGALSRTWLVLAAALGLIAGIVPAAVLGLREWIAPRIPAGLRRIPVLRGALAMLAELPPGRLWDSRMAVATVSLQLGVFLLDTATLAAMLAAIGAHASLALALASFVFASVVATLAWVPGGIGTFEGTCVFLLGGHGVPLQAALAATLLLRGFTFWLPMVPGLVLARRELRTRA
jgi:glycosyltransferase 2 family protein